MCRKPLISYLHLPFSVCRVLALENVCLNTVIASVFFSRVSKLGCLRNQDSVVIQSGECVDLLTLC